MNILVFEDRARTAAELKEFLERYNCEVIVCKNCVRIKEEMGKRDYDLYIIDLNVGVLGLNEEQIEKTQNGLRTGWVLLTEIINKNDSFCVDKTIIFSDYITKLREYVLSDAASEDDKKWFEEITQRGGFIEKQEGYKALKKFLNI